VGRSRRRHYVNALQRNGAKWRDLPHRPIRRWHSVMILGLAEDATRRDVCDATTGQPLRHRSDSGPPPRRRFERGESPVCPRAAHWCESGHCRACAAPQDPGELPDRLARRANQASGARIVSTDSFDELNQGRASAAQLVRAKHPRGDRNARAQTGQLPRSVKQPMRTTEQVVRSRSSLWNSLTAF
jgi:hypothetical protein